MRVLLAALLLLVDGGAVAGDDAVAVCAGHAGLQKKKMQER